MSLSHTDDARRVLVRSGCARSCYACVSCSPAQVEPSLESVLQESLGPTLVLGGGDATRWPQLSAFLAQNQARDVPQEVWLEAPAASLDPQTLEGLAAAGVTGVVIFVESLGARMSRAIGSRDPERVIADAESAGLLVEIFARVRPKSFRMVSPLARRVAPRIVRLQMLRQNVGGSPQPVAIEQLASALAEAPNIEFDDSRRPGMDHLPACLLPQIWARRPGAWRRVLRRRSGQNEVFEACASCGLASSCRFDDADASPSVAPQPVAIDAPGLAIARRRGSAPVPSGLTRARGGEGVICVSPWTTLEIVDPDGRARQCCKAWTVGARGDVSASSLDAVWNGPGYQRARRAMLADPLDDLCLPVCPRLHDGAYSEAHLRIREGSEIFVRNQRVMAEDIAAGRAVTRARPLRIAVAASTYCNFDCIMCDHGRVPTRELPAEIFEQLEGYLPTLETLTLLGGEPLASHGAMTFLRRFNAARYPDASVDLVTNGSLLNAAALRHLRRCTFGNITISVNAGTAAVYEQVQRGTISFEQLLENVDALMEFRACHHRRFGITLSFVVQPESSGSLLEFAEIARGRGLDIRLLPLSVELSSQSDFYRDPVRLAEVVADLERLQGWARRARPRWLREIAGVRAAIEAESSSADPSGRHLPIVP
ncbi:MAG: radical SAM protein [Deltaproteobacteria bacterium]|nr:radical SAM protein [Deltaproteobacteria bacterium]